MRADRSPARADLRICAKKRGGRRRGRGENLDFLKGKGVWNPFTKKNPLCPLCPLCAPREEASRRWVFTVERSRAILIVCVLINGLEEKRGVISTLITERKHVRSVDHVRYQHVLTLRTTYLTLYVSTYIRFEINSAGIDINIIMMQKTGQGCFSY